MALVMTVKLGNAIAELYDDDCNCSEEEMARRRAEVNRVVSRIYADPKVRRRLAERYKREDEEKARLAAEATKAAEQVE